MNEQNVSINPKKNERVGGQVPMRTSLNRIVRALLRRLASAAAQILQTGPFPKGGTPVGEIWI